MNLFKIIPCMKLTILSKMSQDAAAERLEKSISAKSSYFEGHINHYIFHIHRRMKWFERNSFVPVINGEIRKHPQGSEIQITMRLHLLVMTFSLVFLGVLFRIIFGALIKGQYVPLLFLFFATIMGMAFWQIYDGECIQAKNALKKIFT